MENGECTGQHGDPESLRREVIEQKAAEAAFCVVPVCHIQDRAIPVRHGFDQNSTFTRALTELARVSEPYWPW